jgi:hypothetical protein
VFVSAQLDRGAGVLLPGEEEEQGAFTVIMSPLFASLYGFKSKDRVTVERVREESVILERIALVPLTVAPDLDLFHERFASVRAVSQDGLIFLPQEEGSTEWNAFYVLDCGPTLQGTLLFTFNNRASTFECIISFQALYVPTELPFIWWRKGTMRTSSFP